MPAIVIMTPAAVGVDASERAAITAVTASTAIAMLMLIQVVLAVAIAGRMQRRCRWQQAAALRRSLSLLLLWRLLLAGECPHRRLAVGSCRRCSAGGAFPHILHGHGSEGIFEDCCSAFGHG